MINGLTRRKTGLAAGSLFLLGALALLVLMGYNSANADHQPADKVVASGSTIEVAGPGEEMTLLTGTVRSSTPSDLLLSVTAECAITTNLETVGDDNSRAEGSVEVWVEIDGERVGVNNVGTSTTTAEAQDDGEVVFCNRAYERTTSMFDDQNATIETFLDTRQAHGFNWVALNVGNGIHEIEVKARLTETSTNNATAEVAVGNRTLVVEPEKLANDASV